MEKMMSFFKSTLFMKTSGFLLIAGATVAVYYPSFWHMPRADHLVYLADMAGKHDWFSLAIKSYDFTRLRTFAVGDGIIFRPCAIFFLGTEKAVFGYDFFRWQVTGVVLHLLVILALLDLLLTLNKNILAVWFTAFFALLFINNEMVIWHHINSTMLALALTLLSLTQIYRYTIGGRSQTWRIMVASLCSLVAGFTYEAFNLFAVVLAVYLWLYAYATKRKKWPALMVLASSVIYVVTSGLHYYLHRAQVVENNNFFRHLDWGKLFYDLGLANLWWMYSGIFPTQYQIKYTQGRAGLAHPTELLRPLNFADFFVWLGVGLVVMYLVILARTMNWSFLKKRGGFLLSLVSMLVGWGFLIVFYRVNNRGLGFALGGTLNYNYLFWAFFIVLVYALVDFTRWPTSPLSKRGTFVLILLLACLMTANGAMVYRSNQKLAVEQTDTRLLVNQIEIMIKQLGRDPKFSFYVEPNFPGNIPIPNQLRASDDEFKRYSYIELMYLNYFDEKKPSFYFLAADPEGVARVLAIRK